MKRLVLIFILTFSLLFTGCYPQENSPPSVDIVIPSPDEDAGNSDYDDDVEEKKKKYYAVSTVNSLRLRSGAGTNYKVVGYLDKNDAVTLISETNGYYQTVYKEKTAYLSKQYCSVMAIETVDDEEENAIDFGCTLLGYPYVWGSQRYHWGNGKLNTAFKNGEFDCSAFVQYVYYKTNKTILDVTTRTQVKNGKEVKKENLARGDLMFFTNESRQYKTGNERIGHVGIYLGNNYILHTASDHAVIEPISNQRWNFYITARRVV